MAKKSYVDVSNGICAEIIEISEYIEAQMEGNYYERERLTLDRMWVYNFLKNRKFIHYVRAVRLKPEGGIFIKRCYYFDAFLVKRIPRGRGKVSEAWMLYLVL